MRGTRAIPVALKIDGPIYVYPGKRLPRKLKKRLITYYQKRIDEKWKQIYALINKKKPYPSSYAEAFPELYRYEHGEQNVEEYKKLMK